MIAPHPALFAVAVVLAGSLTYDPHILTLVSPDGHEEPVAATSPATCAAAVRAIGAGLWQPAEDGSVTANCRPGDGFAPGSQFIRGFNAPGDRR